MNLKASTEEKDVHYGIRLELQSKYKHQLPKFHYIHTSKQLIYLVFPSLMALGFYLSWVGQDKNWWPIWVLGILFSAVGMNTCFLLIHEGTHGTLAKNPLLNYLFGAVLAPFGFTSYSAYKFLHITHHNHLGTSLDPDEYENLTSNLLTHNLLQINRLLIGTLIYVILFPFITLYWSRGAIRLAILLEYIVLAALILFVVQAFGGWVFFSVWAAPFVITNWMINIRGFSQHGVTDHKDPYLASRTVKTNKLFQFFLINENYHFEHHLFPGVPSYHLPELAETLKNEFPRRAVSDGYLPLVWGFVSQMFSKKKVIIQGTHQN